MSSKRPSKAEIESWISTLRDRDGMTREHAREHLVALGESATSFLLPLLSDHKSQTRWEAAKALSEIADPASIPELLRALEDDDDDVKWLAAVALAAIGPPVTAPLMRTLIDGIESVDVRQGVHHVVRELRETEIGNKIGGVFSALDGVHSDVEIIANAERVLRSIESGD